MFKTLRNAWHVPELKKKMLYTLLMLLIFRLGSVIPVPGLTANALQALTQGGDGGLFTLLDTFSGGAFSQASIFAMSITPYITSSIIIQLLTVAIPALERIAKEGEEGRKKLAQWTRYGTVILAFIQASGLYAGLVNMTIDGGSVRAIPNPNWMTFIVITLTFTAGTAFLMWLGEQITEKGVGNGISLIIFAGIVSRLPSMVNTLYQTYLHGGDFSNVGATEIVTLIIIIIVMILIVGLVVYFNDAERRIPVQYAKRVVGRKMYGGQSTHIPMKVIMAGVIPIIFATSILSFPQTLGMIFRPAEGSFWAGVVGFFTSASPWYAALMFLLIIFFTFFYTAMQFNPVEVANNMKQNGGFVLGIRPGKPTSDYLAKVLSRITFAGAVFIAFIAVLPTIVGFIGGIPNLGFGGTSILIAVGVALETVKQMESQMLMRHYKGFLE